MELDVPFKVLNTHRRGVILQSVPEGLIYRLECGDVITIKIAGKPKGLLSIHTGVEQREAAARLVPQDGDDPADWRHSTTARRHNLRPKTGE